ncbi:MAG: DinB family protein [Chlorobia bacterium]|nr:DinB family protein [Fimbriimonadaceae bacterium]
MTETEWQDCLHRMDEHERYIYALEPAEPDPSASRCVHSRHRTLAHLRACQETWLEACIAFEQRQRPRLKLLHPWRLFERKSYELVPWEEHLAAFKAERLRWKDLLKSADRTKAGKINEKEHSIESLTDRLVGHEHHHLFTPR